jgi:hypothetical protein
MSDITGGPGPLVGFINEAIGQDLNATAALREFRAAGGAINNEAWYQAYGALRQGFSAGQTLSQLASEAVVPGELMTTWAAGTAGEYSTFVEAFFQIPGQHAYETRWFIHTSATAPTRGEAQDAAEEFFTRPDVLGYLGDGATLAFTVPTSVARMTGRAVG